MLYGFLIKLAYLELHKSYFQVPRLESSKAYEHPSWFIFKSFDGKHHKVSIQNAMSATAFSSPKRRWAIVSCYKYSPPTFPEGYEGDTMISQRGSEWLRLYKYRTKKLSFIKQFKELANWTPMSWNADESKVLLHAYPTTMIIEKNGNDRLYLLDTKTLKLTQVFSAFDISWAEFQMNGKEIEIRKESYPEPRINNYTEKSVVRIELSGKIIKKTLLPIRNW